MISFTKLMTTILTDYVVDKPWTTRNLHNIHMLLLVQRNVKILTQIIFQQSHFHAVET
jgi:hypothetical protein